jgi:peptidoglycan L-alanyl-D-glutamate endopeptidase CwlK
MSIERCDDLDELHPKLKELALKLLDEAKRQGLNAKVIDTFRSAKRQDHLYAQGRTRVGNIVTNATGKDMSSYHNWRLAFDCIQNVPGKEYDATFLAKLGKIGQSIGLEWGGGWSGFKDAPHFQFTFGLSIKDLKAGKRPPTEDPALVKAVQKLVLADIIGSPAAWSSVDKINLKNVPALLTKLGGVDKLVKDGVIGSRDLWASGKYSVDHVRSLIIKVASRM